MVYNDDYTHVLPLCFQFGLVDYGQLITRKRNGLVTRYNVSNTEAKLVDSNLSNKRLTSTQQHHYKQQTFNIKP